MYKKNEFWQVIHFNNSPKQQKNLDFGELSEE